jgi:hypothetical protein
MPCVGFEPTIPASERAKIVHSLDRSATVTGITEFTDRKFGIEVFTRSSQRRRGLYRPIKTPLYINIKPNFADFLRIGSLCKN